MEERWLEDFAEVLGEAPLSPDEIELVLDLTREVAHATVRRYAPLCSYLLGAAAGRAGARAEHVPELADVLISILPAPAGGSDGVS